MENQIDDKKVEEVEEVEQTASDEVVEEVPSVEGNTEPSEIEKATKRDKVIRTISRVFVYILLTIGAFTCLFPFYWMIMSSFKTLPEYIQEVPSFFPHKFTNEAYTLAFQYQNSLFAKTLINSLVVGVFSTIVSVALTILAAYAFARVDFKGKNLLFSILLMTMMVPGELFTITNYIQTANWGWQDSYTIMIVPFLCSIYYIYLLRNSFKSIPESLYKAAKVDGCSDFEFLVKIMIPLSAPTIISITILKLIGTWNSYMWPELVNNAEWRLVSNWMASAGGQTDRAQALGLTSDGPVRMAASMIISIPLFIVFILFRKYIMRGVSKSGIKG
jgi:multiple sugar transport system permease protein